MEYRVLGPLEVCADGEPVALGPPQQRTVLAALLIHAGEVVSTDRLIDAVWGEAPPPSAGQALRLYISRLRKALDHGDGEQPIETVRPGYALAVEADQFDAARFERALQLARAGDDPATTVEILDEALRLWRGPAYANHEYDAFAASEIRRLEELRIEALELQLAAELELGRHIEVLGRLERLAAQHPLRESLRGTQMLALYRSGRQAEALQAYAETRRILAEELGLEPGEELSRLEEQILLHDDRLLLRPASPGHNLPTPAAGFVGREPEVAELGELVTSRRMVTLSGPPGVGKTRVAIEVGRRVSGVFGDGVWFVDLAALGDGALVAPTVAATLGVREREGGDATSRLIRYLRDRRLLLILDNCEHLVEPVARVAAATLPAAPHVHILATTRQILRVGGEINFFLAPMPVPASDIDAPAAAAYDAVALFVERATAARRDFRLDAGTAPHVIRSCALLDGLPLAIELAAAKVHAAPIAEIAGRLGDRFHLLAEGERGAPHHHRTLESAVAWSYELASEEERRLFRSLSAFSGGFTGEDAAAIAGPADTGGVIDPLMALVDKSMVTVDTQPEGHLRYRLLEMLREFGRARLEDEGEAEVIRRRHARHFAALAGSADAHLGGPEQVEWLKRLAAEAANFRAAMQWSLDTGDVETGVELAVHLGRYWGSHGDWSEGRDWVHRFLAAGPQIPPGLLGRAYQVAGSLAVHQNDVAAAGEHLTRALGLLREAGDLDRAGDCLNALANVAIERGDLAGGGELYGEAIRTKQEAGTSPLMMLINLGWLALEVGDRSDARDRFEKAYDFARSHGDGESRAWSGLGLGVVDWLEGDLEAAGRHFDASVETWTELEARPTLVYGHVGQALVHRGRSEIAPAAARAAEAVECARDLGGGERHAFSLGIAVSVLSAAGKPVETSRLGSALLALAADHGWPIWSWFRHHLDECLDAARSELGPERFAAAERDGRGMAIGEAVGFAVTELARLV